MRRCLKMSNEYKDYMMDMSEEVLLEHNVVSRIRYITPYHHGYLVIGENTYGLQAYYVWLDDLDGWCWCEMKE